MASVVGKNSRATGQAGESQSSFYNRSGIAFGQRITGRNGYSVTNMRNRGRQTNTRNV